MPKGKTIGVIGAGSIVFNAHLPVLKAMGCELRWVLDASKTRAASVADAYGIPTYLGVDELDNCPESDVILLACPYGTRSHYYDFIKERNGAVYLEKPVARAVAELRKICSLRPDYAMAAGFYRRAMGSTNVVRSAIADGLFGKLHRVRTEFGTATVISAGSGFAKDARLAGGGQLIESAIHNIDAVCYMADITEAEVRRCNMDQENGFDLHTDAEIRLIDRTGGEITMSLLVTCFATTQYEIEMEFENALLNFSLFKRTVPTIRGLGGMRSYRLTDSILGAEPNDAYDTLQVFWMDFLAGWQSSQPNYTNANKTETTTSIIEQLYKRGGVSVSAQSIEVDRSTGIHPLQQI